MSLPFVLEGSNPTTKRCSQGPAACLRRSSLRFSSELLDFVNSTVIGRLSNPSMHCLFKPSIFLARVSLSSQFTNAYPNFKSIDPGRFIHNLDASEISQICEDFIITYRLGLRVSYRVRVSVISPFKLPHKNSFPSIFLKLGGCTVTNQSGGIYDEIFPVILLVLATFCRRCMFCLWVFWKIIGCNDLYINQ